MPLTLLVGASAYCFGAGLAGILVRFRRGNGLISNVSIVTFMTLCGVNVPLAAYPEPVTWISQALPLTHGLIGIREVLAGNIGFAM